MSLRSHYNHCNFIWFCILCTILTAFSLKKCIWKRNNHSFKMAHPFHCQKQRYRHKVLGHLEKLCLHLRVAQELFPTALLSLQWVNKFSDLPVPQLATWFWSRCLSMLSNHVWFKCSHHHAEAKESTGTKTAPRASAPVAYVIPDVWQCGILPEKDN